MTPHCLMPIAYRDRFYSLFCFFKTLLFHYVYWLMLSSRGLATDYMKRMYSAEIAHISCFRKFSHSTNIHIKNNSFDQKLAEQLSLMLFTRHIIFLNMLNSFLTGLQLLH